MFLKILALVKVVDEFDLKILANLVNILNNDDTKVRALRASVTRTIWAAYDNACIMCLLHPAWQHANVGKLSGWAWPYESHRS